MAEQLGKIERPAVEGYRSGRRLLFVPLVFAPKEAEAELQEMVDKYWEQVESHVAGMEARLGQVKEVYHEMLPIGGEDGAKAIEELSQGSYRVAGARLDNGARLEPIEDPELLAEFMDWNRCLSVGLQSEKALKTVYDFYAEAHKRRNEHIAKKIDETLKEDDIGILLMREGHQVQFAQDIRVFYVAPPGLDEIKRWVRARNESEEREAKG
ncbi:MAG: hypothetical protein Q7T04_08205 [Dehalococcoidia bacterium]|nr:hypothetical protein [Dehalococcoidia bacterium]